MNADMTSGSTLGIGSEPDSELPLAQVTTGSAQHRSRMKETYNRRIPGREKYCHVEQRVS
jgi:hypothetical protein